MRSLDIGKPLVTFTPPSALAFLASVTAGLTGEAVQDRLAGWVGTVAGLGACAREVAGVDDVLDAARAVLECVGLADEAIARRAAVALLKARPGLTPQQAGKRAGAVVGRITIYLALVGPVFSSMNYLAELALPEASRQLTAYPTTVGATDVVTLNPFAADGSLLPGYSLDDARTDVTGAPPVDCSYDRGAVSGTTPGTHWCGTTADGTHECWAPPVYPDAVVCMYTPWNREARDPIGGRARRHRPAGGPAANGDRADRRVALVGADRWLVGCARRRVHRSLWVRPVGAVPRRGCRPARRPGSAGRRLERTHLVCPAGRARNPDEHFPPPDRMPVARAYFIASTF